jgi:hypothetical protein
MWRSGTRAETKATHADTDPEVYPTESEGMLADHGLHVDNEPCARCGRDIKPTQDARRTAKGDLVHLTC